MTGLMNSGTIMIEMSSPRPRKVFAIAIATAEPEQELDRRRW